MNGRISEGKIRIVIWMSSEESSEMVIFHFLQELDGWLQMRFRKQLLKGEDGDSSRKLDVLSEVHGYVVMN